MFHIQVRWRAHRYRRYRIRVLDMIHDRWVCGQDVVTITQNALSPGFSRLQDYVYGSLPIWCTRLVFLSRVSMEIWRLLLKATMMTIVNIVVPSLTVTVNSIPNYYILFKKIVLVCMFINLLNNIFSTTLACRRRYGVSAPLE